MNAMNIIKNRKNEILAIATDEQLYTVLAEMVNINDPVDTYDFYTEVRVERFVDNFTSENVEIDYKKLGINL